MVRDLAREPAGAAVVVEPARLIVADPPWAMGDALPGKTRGAARNYDVLPTSEIARYPLPRIAPDALLMLWRLSSMPEDALFVARAWGFSVKSEIVWVKTTGDDAKLHFGMGRTVRAAHETCLIATRGKANSLVLDHAIRSVFFAPTGAHSEKPALFFDLAERLFPGPRVEIFARGVPRPGWTTYGRESWGSPETPSL